MRASANTLYDYVPPPPPTNYRFPQPLDWFQIEAELEFPKIIKFR